jgi:hypothetical protein
VTCSPSATPRGLTAENEDRIDRRDKPVKSNLTDNESAKLVSSHGVIQGYNGIATAGTSFSFIDPGKKPFESVLVTASSGFSSEEAVAAVLDAEIDAYIADPQFRKRDPRCARLQKPARACGTTRRAPLGG